MKMNKINIVDDFNSKLKEISEKFDVNINSTFRALNKTKFFDLKKTDEITSLQVVLNVEKCINDDRKLYESVSRNRRFGARKYDKLNKELLDCFEWFSKYSNLIVWSVYKRKTDSLGEVVVKFKFRF